MPALPAGAGASEVVVVDNGTGFLKAGFAADNLPPFSFPTIVGRPWLPAQGDVPGHDARSTARMAAGGRAGAVSGDVGVLRGGAQGRVAPGPWCRSAGRAC